MKRELEELNGFCAKTGSKLHFDTRQFNHIIWDAPEDIRSKLYYESIYKSKV
jgi:hypothetical protein